MCLAEDRGNKTRYFKSLEGQGKDQRSLDASHSILVLDAGSGTVDLVIYHVESKGIDLLIKEGRAGTGQSAHSCSCGIVSLTQSQLAFVDRRYSIVDSVNS